MNKQQLEHSFDKLLQPYPGEVLTRERSDQIIGDIKFLVTYLNKRFGYSSDVGIELNVESTDLHRGYVSLKISQELYDLIYSSPNLHYQSNEHSN